MRVIDEAFALAKQHPHWHELQLVAQNRVIELDRLAPEEIDEGYLRLAVVYGATEMVLGSMIRTLGWGDPDVNQARGSQQMLFTWLVPHLEPGVIGALSGMRGPM